MIFYLSIITILLTASAAYNNYHTNKHTLYLSAYLLILSLYTLVHYLVFDGESVLAIALLFKHISPLFYLPGVMLFFYVRGILTPYKPFTKQDLWHFVPFLIGALNIIPYIFAPFSFKMELATEIYSSSNFSKLSDAYLFYPFYISAFIRSGLFVHYSAASIYLLIEHRKKQANDLIPVEIRNQYRWLQFITATGLLLAVCLMLISLTFYIYKDVSQTDFTTQYIMTAAGFCFVLIPIVMLFFPHWVSDYRSVIKTADKRLEKKDLSSNDAKKKELDELALRVVECLEVQKPYLKKEFSTDDLAELLNVPKHQLQHCFKWSIRKKFSELRSYYRIQYVKQLLVSEDMEKYSLEEVWTKAGFSSKSNFFITFREEMGCTPSEYLEQTKQSNTLT